jgi:glutamate-1-semialdehyde 2,1-aminomutase
LTVKLALRSAESPLERAHRCIADAFHDVDIVSAPLASGFGAEVWDVEGRRLIDYTMSKGAVLLGHADPRVNGAVAAYLEQGGAALLFSGPFHEREVRVAEILQRLIPCAEKVRFFKTGSCATSAAARLARIVTGGDLVLTSGYHGWHDWALEGMEAVPRSRGSVINFSYDLDCLRKLLFEYTGRVACILVTPEPNFFGPELLIEMRHLADEAGIPLIFDEVKTGFRFTAGGYQRKIGITPDLAVFSKGLANGFALAALVGRRYLMDAAAKTNLSSTYRGELPSFVAAEKTLQILESEPVLEHIWNQGARLISGLQEIFDRRGVAAEIFAHPPLFHIVFDDSDDARVFHRLSFDAGVLTYPFDNQALSLAHGAVVIDKSLNLLEKAVASLPNRRSAGGRGSGAVGRISRAALDRYTRFEFGGVVTNYAVKLP